MLQRDRAAARELEDAAAARTVAERLCVRRPIESVGNSGSSLFVLVPASLEHLSLTLSHLQLVTHTCSLVLTLSHSHLLTGPHT